ncbi:unnamed protein product, partial [Rotaria sp. Silwood1]
MASIDSIFSDETSSSLPSFLTSTSSSLSSSSSPVIGRVQVQQVP